MIENNAETKSGLDRQRPRNVGFPMKQREILRAFKAAKCAGSSITRVEVNPSTGVVSFFCAEQGKNLSERDEYATWKAGRS